MFYFPVVGPKGPRLGRVDVIKNKSALDWLNEYAIF